MILVHRPTEPAILKTKGRTLALKHCADYDLGKTDFRFDKTIYGHPSVKAALRAAQHDKCCFCESKISHVSSGDIEHFRPKAGFKQWPGDPLSRPGYYWLVYDWTNLFFCCEKCNRLCKRSYFPLSNPKKRALSHQHDLSAEHPLLINPATEDPAQFIEFHDAFPSPKNRSTRGRATIKAFALDTRRELIERRQDCLRDLKIRHDHRLILVKEIANAEREGLPELTTFRAALEQIDADLGAMVDDSAEYAAMCRAALAEWNSVQ